MNFSDHGIQIPPGSAGEIRTLCPGCSPHRQKSTEKCLAVNIDKGTWYCHHCGWSGGLNNPTDTREREFTPKTHKKPSYTYRPDALPKEIIAWFNKRGIPESILAANKISYGPSFGTECGMQFPYFRGGAAVNVKHRTLDKKFRQEKDAEKILYRYDEISNGSGELIITEGEIDTLSCLAAGFQNATSIPDGAPAPRTKHFNTKFDFLESAGPALERFKKIILAVDNDPPGQTAEAELARRIGPEKCFRVEYPKGCKDSNDVLVQYGPERLREVIKSARPYPVEGLFGASDLKAAVLSLYDNGENRGALTGWPALDPYYTVKPGEMTVITGIPGSGKSNFVDALMTSLSIQYGWTFAVFSPENWPLERHIQSLLEKAHGKPFSAGGKFSTRMSRAEVERGISELNPRFRFVMPGEEVLSVDTILEKTRIEIFRHGVRGLVIDPWNELEHLYGRLTEAQYLSQELTKIRRFARKNSIHIWVVAHPKNLSKAENGTYKPPTMYEISGGAHWRNKADNGICVHRPDYNRDETEIIIQKIRFREVGKIGQVTLKYCRDSGRYFDGAGKALDLEPEPEIEEGVIE